MHYVSSYRCQLWLSDSPYGCPSIIAGFAKLQLAEVQHPAVLWAADAADHSLNLVINTRQA